MKVTLRSIMIENFGSSEEVKEQTLNLPGCLLTASGQPLIVGVYAGQNVLSSETRIWYLSEVYPFESSIDNNWALNLQRFNAEELNEIAEIAQEVMGYIPLVERYSIAAKILEAGYVKQSTGV